MRDDPFDFGPHTLSAGARRVVPYQEGTGSQRPVVSRPKQVAPHAEQIPNEAVHGQESLRVSHGFEPPHLSLTLTGRLMRDFSAIVLVLRRAVHDRGHDAAVGRRVAAQFVRDQTSRSLRRSLLIKPPFSARGARDRRQLGRVEFRRPDVEIGVLETQEGERFPSLGARRPISIGGGRAPVRRSEGPQRRRFQAEGANPKERQALRDAAAADGSLVFQEAGTVMRLVRGPDQASAPVRACSSTWEDGHTWDSPTLLR